MKFTSERERILEPLQAVIGVVERRQTMPILANVLLSAKNGRLAVTATDLEVELVAGGEVTVQQAGDITVPGRKLLDIVRALPDKASVTFALEGEKAGRSRRQEPLHADDAAGRRIPGDRGNQSATQIRGRAGGAKRLIDKTHFSMAQQDVRYYLNGMLLESDGKLLRTVATDGHRLALCEMELVTKSGQHQVIVPRKGVLELQRLIGSEGVVAVEVGSNHIRVTIGDIRFTSKLVDGRFPEYGRVIPATPPRTVACRSRGLAPGAAAHVDPGE